MNLNDFDYPLPKELIAQRPLGERDASRLLVVDRQTGQLEDKYFSDILKTIPAGDVLVLNDTKVFPARLFGKKKKTHGKVEVLLLEPVSSEENTWKCLTQPALKEGQEVYFEPTNVEAAFLKRDDQGTPILEFKNVKNVRNFAFQVGSMPLPPYVKRAADPKDEAAYQTVYASKEGAVAAPTAGLHFTAPLLDHLREKGIEILFLTLHVGYGTFKPVEDLANHRMHAEYFEISSQVADKINSAKEQKRKIWTVGTTSLRALETCVQNGTILSGRGKTDLYIRPGFDFEAVDHLITNFHLPKTTLLLLVSAFMGEPLRKKAYEHALKERYRFYSYGDAMLVI